MLLLEGLLLLLHQLVVLLLLGPRCCYCAPPNVVDVVRVWSMLLMLCAVAPANVGVSVRVREGVVRG